MDMTTNPGLDRTSIERAAHAVRAISDDELVVLLSSWRSIIGVDLVMSRWMLRPEERENFDRAAAAVRKASDERIRAARRDEAIIDETAHERLAEMALGYLVASAWSTRLSPDQRRRMAAAWRLVAPKRTAA